MSRFINRALLAGLLGLLSALAWAEEQSTAAAEPGLVISSGSEGGGYWSAAARLQAVVQGLGASAENLPSAGSLANLEAMTDPASPVNLAFAQADAVQYFLYDKPGARPQIDVLENIGQECVFIIAAAGSAAKTDQDLQDADNYRLGIGSHTSGVAVTFNYMSRLVPEFGDIEVVYGDTGAAVEQLGTPDTPVDAVMVVHRPREHSPELDLALRNAERYRVLAIGDKRLTKTPDDGQEVYRAMNLAIPVGEDAPPARVDTICVKGLLVANREKLSEGQQNLMTDVVNSHWMRVFATQ
jgi:TRAP-type uncharacterized transport system substrate-binding protein